MAVYQISPTSFTSSIAVNGGNIFGTPLSVVLDPDGEVNITIEVVNYSGGSDGVTLNTGPFSSLVNFPIDHLTSSGEQYLIRLINANQPSTVNLNGGSVYS